MALVGMALGSAFTMNAINITTEAGGLKTAVGDNTDITSLVVSGTINAADFDFIAFEMTKLTNLDLSGCTIVAYDGDATFSGRTTSAAAAIPEGGLMSVQSEVIHLPSTMTVIGDGALANTAVKSITIPRYVTTIGRSAFNNATKLESITIPASVTTIGENAFAGCTALKQVVIEGSVEKIAANAFAGCTALTSVTLPDGVKTIDNDAFAGCEALTTINFPTTLTSINARAFYGCGLSSLSLNGCQSLTNIGEWAFAANQSLTSVTLPSNVVALSRGTFFNNSALKLTSLPLKLESVGDYALAGVGDANSDVLAETGIKIIGAYGVAYWKNIQVVKLPANLTSLGDGAMADWSSLQTIDAGATAQVPLLGDDVWGDLEKSSVLLSVPSDLYATYIKTAQWKDFKIRAGATGNHATVSDDSQKLSATFEGLTLHIAAPSDIAAVEVYDLSGRAFFMPMTLAGSTADIDTSAWDAQVMVVRVVMTNGTAAGLKLSR
jgi:hypothetical protein